MKGLYEKRGWYYYQPPTPKGGIRPKAIALKTKDYLTAVTEAMREKDTTELQFAVRRMTLEEILPRYYRDKAESRKETRLSRERILTGFLEILGNPRVDQIDVETMQIWWDHLGTKGGSLKGKGAMKPASKKSYLITVRAFLNWAISEGLLKGDPLKRLRVHTRVKGTRIEQFHTVEERERVLVAAQDSPIHIRFILHMGYFAGLRDAEMLAMTPAWIWISSERDRGTITVQDTPIMFQNGTRTMWQPKGKRRRVIPMHPRLITFLETYGTSEPFMLAPEKDRWPDENKKSKRFDPKKALKTLAGKAKVTSMNYHILRHSFATHLAMKGVPLAQIAGLLGDGLKVTEDRYAGFCPSKENPLAIL